MTFFNKKEEILELKLSSYGKQKLAAGTFKPVYYAFFDDDVLYDGARAGISEDNNDIEPRIQENSPSLRVQTNFTDLEKKVKRQTHNEINEIFHESNVTDYIKEPSVFKDYDGLRNVLPLGKSQLGNPRVAAWRLEFLNGEFYSSNSNINEPNLKPIINIPQIDSEMLVRPVLVDKDFKGVTDPETDKFIYENMDSSQFIRLLDDYILLDIEENNVDLLNDSFSMEVYEITTNADNEEILIPKMFKKQIVKVVDGILLDQEEIDAQISKIGINETFAEYYFNITFDDKIDGKTISEKIAPREKRGNIFDSNIAYEEFKQTPGAELYTSDNDGEDC